MKKLVFGDIHGRQSVLEYIIDHYAETHDLVSVGDLADSFNKSVGEQATCIRKMLALVQDDPRHTYIWGNHEMSYMHKNERCDGWNYALQAHLDLISMQLRRNLKFFHTIPSANVLITHAGVSRRWLNALDVDTSSTDSILQYLEARSRDFDPCRSNHPFLMTGPGRSGYAQCGGLLWCAESEFVPIDGFNQIYGHTHKPNVIVTSHDNGTVDINIDVFDNTFAVVEIDGPDIYVVEIDVLTGQELKTKVNYGAQNV